MGSSSPDHMSWLRIASPALRADIRAVVAAEADPVDVGYHEIADKGITLEAVVHVDLAVAGDLTDLAIVFIPAPAVGAGPSGASSAVSAVGREKKADNVSSRLMGPSSKM